MDRQARIAELERKIAGLEARLAPKRTAAVNVTSMWTLNEIMSEGYLEALKFALVKLFPSGSDGTQMDALVEGGGQWPRLVIHRSQGRNVGAGTDGVVNSYSIEINWDRHSLIAYAKTGGAEMHAPVFQLGLTKLGPMTITRVAGLIYAKLPSDF